MFKILVSCPSCPWLESQFQSFLSEKIIDDADLIDSFALLRVRVEGTKSFMAVVDQIHPVLASGKLNCKKLAQ